MRRLLYFWLVCTALLAWYWAPPIALTETLKFRDRSFPLGFRELILSSGVSQLESMSGLPQAGMREPTKSIAVGEICDALFNNAASPAASSPAVKLQIAAFLDYRCPYCKKLTRILTDIESSDIQIAYKEWPILGADSILAARAALAADKQGKYRAFHMRLMDARLVPTQAYLEAVAAELGLENVQLRSDMNDQPIALELQRVSRLASSLSLNGTPALVVGRTIVQGEITGNQLKRLVDAEMLPQSPKVCQSVSDASQSR